MFWGLIMQPNKRYMQTVERAFHLSMASLDATMSSDCLVQVMVCYDKRNYLLCTLQKNSIWQVPLDLNFQEGTKIGFTFNGDGHVHLTGYLIPDEGLDELDDFEEEDDEDIPKLVGGKKRKASNSPIEQNDVKQSKTSKVAEDEDDDDDDDESDSDNEDGVLEDDSDDDLDSEEEDMDEDESDEEDEDEDEIETPVKPSKKQKQKQNQQNQSNQQKLQNQQNQQRQNQQNNQQQNKKDKNKLINGKDAKSEREQGKQKKNKEDSKMEDKSEQQQQQKRTIEGGVQVEDIKVGNGAPAKSGKFVSVYYIGRLKNGKKFDQTQQGEGFKFRLGKGEVIKGWDVGVTGMKVGGKRRLTIPPNMAYGAKGSPPVIPGNSTLNFEIELKAIH